MPNYGWPHKNAGKSYLDSEMSFRQTIHGKNYSDRGFRVQIDNQHKKVLISFNSKLVDIRHQSWLEAVNDRVGLKELNPQPYWGFDDLKYKAGTKLLNCFFVQAEVKKNKNQEYYHYTKILMLKTFSFQKLLNELAAGHIFIDFDARTGHNHGTKFRIKQKYLPNLYEENLNL